MNQENTDSSTPQTPNAFATEPEIKPAPEPRRQRFLNNKLLFLGIILVILVAIGAFASFYLLYTNTKTKQAQTTTPLLNYSGWETYDDKKIGFEFKYPSDWSIDANPGGSSVVYILPQSRFMRYNEYYPAPIQLTIFEKPFNVTQDEWISKLLSDYFVGGEKIKTTQNGYTTYVYRNKKGTDVYNYREIMIGKHYVLVFSLADSYSFSDYSMVPATFSGALTNIKTIDITNGIEKNQRVFNTILSTFKLSEIIPPTPTPVTVSGWKTYANKEFSYSYKYPPDGKVTEGGNYGVDGVFNSSPNSTSMAGGGFQLTLTVSKNSNNETINDLIADIATPLASKNSKNANLDIEGNPVKVTTISGGQAAEGAVGGPFGAYDIKILHNNYIYDLYFEPGISPETQALLDSFRFTN